MGRLGRDDARSALRTLAPAQLPAAQGDDRAAEGSSETNLRERAPLAADRDHRIAGGDDREVAGMTYARGDDVSAVRVRFADGVARDDPDRDAIGLGYPRAALPHHPGQPAADEPHARVGQPPADLLGEQHRLGAR